MLRAKLSIMHVLDSDFNNRVCLSIHIHTRICINMPVCVYAYVQTNMPFFSATAEFVNCENGTSGIAMPPSSTLKYCSSFE